MPHQNHHLSNRASSFQDEQQPLFWLTGCPRICTVGGRALFDAGWLAILQMMHKILSFHTTEEQNCNSDEAISNEISKPVLD